jgi:hypothetical protein
MLRNSLEIALWTGASGSKSTEARSVRGRSECRHWAAGVGRRMPAASRLGLAPGCWRPGGTHPAPAGVVNGRTAPRQRATARGRIAPHHRGPARGGTARHQRRRIGLGGRPGERHKQDPCSPVANVQRSLVTRRVRMAAAYLVRVLCRSPDATSQARGRRATAVLCGAPVARRSRRATAVLCGWPRRSRRATAVPFGACVTTVGAVRGPHP